MVAPAVILTMVLGIIPMITSLIWSFQEYDLVRGPASENAWVGFKNYRQIFAADNFIQTTVNTLLITGIVVVSAISLGLILSQVMNAEFRGRAIIRVLICAPWFVPPVVAAVIWVWMLNTERSPITALLMDWGLIEQKIRFLTSRETWGPFSAPLLSVAAVRVWNGLPFITIFLLAGLQSIPRDVYEAAEVDGANLWTKFRHVTLPLLKPVVMVLLMLLLITGVGHFEINYIMTGGGPRNMTNVMAVYSYLQAFSFFRFDLASAASGVILIVSIIICIFYIRSQLKDKDAV